jgi:hypothetical protein
LEDLGVDGRIILNWVFEEWDGAWPGSSWLRIGTGEGSFERGNKPAVPVK